MTFSSYLFSSLLFPMNFYFKILVSQFLICITFNWKNAEKCIENFQIKFWFQKVTIFPPFFICFQFFYFFLPKSELWGVKKISLVQNGFLMKIPTTTKNQVCIAQWNLLLWQAITKYLEKKLWNFRKESIRQKILGLVFHKNIDLVERSKLLYLCTSITHFL